MQQWLQTPAAARAAQEAARLDLNTEEIGQFFHARMLQSLGRLRIDGGQVWIVTYVTHVTASMKRAAVAWRVAERRGVLEAYSRTLLAVPLPTACSPPYHPLFTTLLYHPSLPPPPYRPLLTIP